MPDSHITIAGHATMAELRFTGTGKAVASFSVACRRSWKVGTEWEERTTWYKVTCWDQLAENVAASLIDKGVHVIVSGVPEMTEYEDREGNKRQSLELRPDFVGVTLRSQRVTVEKVVRERDGEERDTTPQSSRQAESTLSEEEPF